MSASDKDLPVHEFSAILKQMWSHCVFLKQLGIALKEVGCRIRTSQVFSELGETGLFYGFAEAEKKLRPYCIFER